MESIEVTTKEGKLQGSISKDYHGNTIYNFQGIPYAKPPLGPLRFKAPEPLEPWTGTLDATKHGNVSYSRDLLNPGLVQGSENCLFLNVYTRGFKTLKPVMFWVHGGGFVYGSGNTDYYGPEFLLAENVVLVTINYRLGLFGFISFEDSRLGVPGNAAFKDMIQALQWVQRNVRAFGGNPNNVTVFGQSAGGAAVHLLQLSPLSKGLFHKVIAQSGLALLPSMQVQKGVARIKQILNVTTDQEVYQYLMAATPERVLEVQEKLAAMDVGFPRFCGFVLEQDSDAAFLAQNPETIISNGTFNQVSLMVGYLQNEGMIMQLQDPELELPVSLTVNYPLGTPEFEALNQDIRAMYETDDPFWKYPLYTDCGFFIWIYSLLRNQLPRSGPPVFLYRMSVETELNIFKKLMQLTGPGACHQDDVFYLFKTSQTPDIVVGSKEDKARTKIVKMWTSFAKYGNPTLELSTLIDTRWSPVTEGNLECLDIGEQLKMIKDPALDRMKFWNTVFNK